ncbi:hypothetical protein JTB14_031161 [Gonioctena quinquepunctata]|nr:hypothetical protein JTB14_031161 [Gonioctena quinquepunctata]
MQVGKTSKCTEMREMLDLLSLQDKCNGPDRTKCCYKCGSNEHRPSYAMLRNTSLFVRNQATKLDHSLQRCPQRGQIGEKRWSQP